MSTTKRDKPDPAFVEEVTARPFETYPEGSFFYGVGEPRLPDGTPYTALGPSGRFYLRVRHVPTDGIVALLLDRFGDDARDLVERWRRLWERMSDGPVDASAPRIGYREPETDTDDHFDQILLALQEGRPDGETAVRLVHLSLRPEPIRSLAHHALEDAAYAMALVEAGADVVFQGKDFRGEPGRRGLEWRQGYARGDWWQACSGYPRYWMSEAYLRTCGRKMRLACSWEHAVLMLLDIARRGGRKAFVKDKVQKGGTWVLDLAEVVDFNGACGAFAKGLGADLFRLRPFYSGDKNGLLIVQEFATFAFEHRFFVIEGRIVASTPSDRSLSALDVHEGPGRLDPRVARLKAPADGYGSYDRGDAESVRNRPLVVAMAKLVRRFLREVGKDVHDEAILGDAFVVDAGSDDEDPSVARIGLVEVNCFDAGLYAVDVDRLARAVAASGRRKALAAAEEASRREASDRKERDRPVPTYTMEAHPSADPTKDDQTDLTPTSR